MRLELSDPRRPLSQRLLGRELDSWRISLLWTVALLAPSAVVLFARELRWTILLLSGAALAVAWQWLFARLRRRRFLPDGWLIAAGLLVLCDPATPAWQWFMALSFAVVLGDQVFGGRGRYLLSPVLVGAAFQWFSFPPAAAPQPVPGLGLASLAGLSLLLLHGLLSWRIVAAALLGLGLLLALASATVWPSPDAILIYAMAFVLTDPSAAAATRTGRWWYGLLAAVLIYLLSEPGQAVGGWRALLFGLLLAQLFAPLIDRGVLAVVAWRERRRYA